MASQNLDMEIILVSSGKILAYKYLILDKQLITVATFTYSAIGLTPVYVPHAIRELSTFSLVYC